MNKEEQLKRAKSLSITFLHIPIATTEYSPIVVKHPYFESAFLYDYDSKTMFNALKIPKNTMNFFILMPTKTNSSLAKVLRNCLHLSVSLTA